MNVSRSACTVQGYPKVRFFDFSGRVIGAPERQGGGYQIDDPGPSRVNLLPGNTAYFAVQWSANNPPDKNWNGCLEAKAIEVVPPANIQRLRASIHLRAGNVCPSGGVSATAVALPTAFLNASPIP